MRAMIDAENPPRDPSLAEAYWCDVDYFLAHTASGDHPPCCCGAGTGHNDPAYASKRAAFIAQEVTR